VKALNSENATRLATCMGTLNKYLTSGLLTDQYVLDNTADLVNCARDTNDAVKWRMLHRYAVLLQPSPNHDGTNHQQFFARSYAGGR
jgi:hypothetical protein